MAGQKTKCVNCWTDCGCDKRDQGPAKRYKPNVPEGMILIDVSLIKEIIDLTAIPARIKETLIGWIRDA